MFRFIRFVEDFQRPSIVSTLLCYAARWSTVAQYRFTGSVMRGSSSKKLHYRAVKNVSSTLPFSPIRQRNRRDLSCLFVCR